MEVLFKWAKDEPYSINSDMTIDPTRLIEAGVHFAGTPHIEAILQRKKGYFEVEGELKARLTIPCSRCLEPYSIDISRHVHMVLLPQPPNTTFVEVAVEDEEDLDVSYTSQEKILLEDLVCEQINLALPMRPLCTDGCKGICPSCGADLNAGPCSCPQEMLNAGIPRA